MYLVSRCVEEFLYRENMDGVYMIPSSVHEFLLLVMDKEYVNCGYVKQMIKEANKESLSDSTSSFSKSIPA